MGNWVKKQTKVRWDNVAPARPYDFQGDSVSAPNFWTFLPPTGVSSHDRLRIVTYPDGTITAALVREGKA